MANIVRSPVSPTRIPLLRWLGGSVVESSLPTPPLYARSGIARSGATRSGYFNHHLAMTVGGTSRVDKLWKRSLVINRKLDERPNTCRFRAFGYTPLAGQEVIVGDGAIDNRVFAGTIQRVRQLSVRAAAKEITEVECGDWTRLFNRRLVNKAYSQDAAHTIASDIVTTFTTGFTTTNITAGAPTVTGGISFNNVRPMNALVTLARRVGWRVYIDADKDVHFFATETSQAPTDITATNTLYDRLEAVSDLSQIKTRVYVVGGGGRATAPVSVGATSVPTDECGWYAAAGGTVQHGPGAQEFTYTARSASSGPGNITGVPASGAGSIGVAIKQGDSLWIKVMREDTAAQTALAAKEGGDGIHEAVVTDHRIGIAEAEKRGDAELVLFDTEVNLGTFVTRDRFADVGKSQTITLPARGLSLTATIDSVQLTMRAHERPSRTISYVNGVRFSLADIIKGTPSLKEEAEG